MEALEEKSGLKGKHRRSTVITSMIKDKLPPGSEYARKVSIYKTARQRISEKNSMDKTIQ